ncbi:hypothetical protein RINTU1_09140 [Candidatus Regiella insecticola]|uniref:Uncharacterized protein n=1 Tax=Candidatus Regiella insecticola TaxID=138073 RepID=A0A6L2ZMB6_9ENTR|nr:hypothetical protein RINTU1_09140 [Candidatus Regiella insecticola]
MTLKSSLTGSIEVVGSIRFFYGNTEEPIKVVYPVINNFFRLIVK